MEAEVVSDQPFCVRSKELAILELRSRPPWVRFRLEARVRHEDSQPDEGEVGIYVAHNQYDADNKRCYHALGTFGFADKGKGPCRGKTDFRIWHLPVLPPHTVSGSASGPVLFFDPARLIGDSRPWRKLALEVTPEEIRGYWEDAFVGSLSQEVMENKQTAALLHLPFLNWQFDPTGGLGLFVDSGTASFRDVRISPLNKE
jgi:hypothetical protein